MRTDDLISTLLVRRPLAILLLVALALLLPGLTTLPPQDRDEPRFAQASKQMLETGDFVDIRFGEEARNKKPVGIYWLQAASVRLGEIAGLPDARQTIWLYRLPSLLGALATVLLTYWVALALTSRENAVMAGLLMAATALLGVEARLATTDAVVAATVAGCMGALARVFIARDEDRRPGWGPCLVVWTSLGIGLLIKGPITPMVPALAALVLCVRIRRWRWLLALRPLVGGLFCLALVLPWFILILVRTHGGFLSESLGHDMIGKIAGAQERHGLPPGSYLIAFWLSGWPIAPFAALAVPSLWKSRREEAIGFLLAWLVPSWVLFEAVPTKLFHYVLPLYPALAILAVLGLRRLVSRPSLPALLPWLFMGLLALVPLGILVAMLVLQPLIFTITPLTLSLGVAAVVVSLALIWQAGRGLSAHSAARAIGFGVAAALPVYAFGLGVLPNPSVAVQAAVSPRLIEAAHTALSGGCGEPLYATTGDREPSLMFLTGARLVMTDPGGAASFLAETPCRVAFVEKLAEPEFLGALDPALAVRLAERVAGIALNGGKPLDIGVYVRQ